MRLNKYISHAGVTSRRKADELLKNGNVKINNIVIGQPGYDVKENDVVEVNGFVVKPTVKMIYIMLNKPKGYITSLKDEQDRPIVTDLITDITERLFPIGRLDYNTSGLLLLTNDGDMANKLARPAGNVAKTYRALVNGHVSPERLARLRDGVDIGGYITLKAEAEIIKHCNNSTVVELKIREGKNRQVRKMFAAIGNKTIELERIAIGDIHIRNLKEGHYRKLDKGEVEYLRKL